MRGITGSSDLRSPQLRKGLWRPSNWQVEGDTIEYEEFVTSRWMESQMVIQVESDHWWIHNLVMVSKMGCSFLRFTSQRDVLGWEPRWQTCGVLRGGAVVLLGWVMVEMQTEHNRLPVSLLRWLTESNVMLNDSDCCLHLLRGKKRWLESDSGLNVGGIHLKY